MSGVVANNPVRLAASEIAVGHCVIINHVEQPYGRLVSVIVGIDGDHVKTNYLNCDKALKPYNRKGCVNTLSEVTPVGMFGVEVQLDESTRIYQCVVVGESKATYTDGKVRPWQDGGSARRYLAFNSVLNVALRKGLETPKVESKSVQKRKAAQRPKPVAKDFAIEQDCVNSFKLTIRGQQWTIGTDYDEPLRDEDIELFQRIEDLMNQHAKLLLGG